MARASSAGLGGVPGRRTRSAPMATAATISPRPTHPRPPARNRHGATPIKARLAAMAASVNGP